ncbi:MATE family efflux transporter [Rapidithrix thailandica]|uniref:Multidrug export protein MepA n=1 Tax=Rapidithrix thailandica TaxID=413964 RepID=A0AAW9RV52_9BACT
MDLKEKQKHLMLYGALPEVMWKLSLPAIIAMVLFGLNAFLDAVFVGQLIDKTALAGVSIAYPLSQITFGLGSLVGVGAGTVLSIALGANDTEVQKRLLGNMLWLSLWITVLFAVPTSIFAEELVAFMGGEGQVLALGTAYFKTTLIGAFFWIHGLALNMLIRGEGKIKEAALMMALGLLINIILNPVFILFFDMGVRGAAWATNVAMLIYTLIGYWYFITDKASFVVNVSYLGWDKKLLKSICSTGMPSLIMSVMSVIQAIVVFNVVAGLGNEPDIAFYGAANRILLFMMTPLFGLMRALQPVAGINYGAKQYDRVIQAYSLFTKTGFWVILPFWLLMTLFPQLTLSTMLPGFAFGEGELLNFRVYIFVLPFLPVIFMALVLLPSIENGRMASLLVLARQVVFYIPVMLLLPKLTGLSGVYWGSTGIDIVIIACTYLMVVTAFSKIRKLQDQAVLNG